VSFNYLSTKSDQVQDDKDGAYARDDKDGAYARDDKDGAYARDDKEGAPTLGMTKRARLRSG